MKLLYITPNIVDAGGLVRVISAKTNYLVNNFKYEIHIQTQNNQNQTPFYSFNNKIKIHNTILNGSSVIRLYKYVKAVSNLINDIKPDVVVVCDGFKGLFLPLFLKNKCTFIFEVHGSIHNSTFATKANLFSNFKIIVSNFSKRKLASFFDKIIVLNNASLNEWNTENIQIITNANWINTNKTSSLENKVAIAVARNSYEKGIDRLLAIWQEVIKEQPDWVLKIYGDFSINDENQKLVSELKLNKNVFFFESIKNIKEKYIDATLYLMASRFEGFGLSLVEAMSCGLIPFAYDCPVGPKEIISDQINGFLIENNHKDEYVRNVLKVIKNIDNYKYIAENGILESEKYNVENIMNKWNELFLNLKKR